MYTIAEVVTQSVASLYANPNIVDAYGSLGLDVNITRAANKTAAAHNISSCSNDGSNCNRKQATMKVGTT